MNKENGKSISRRDFFKIAGAAGVVTAGLVTWGLIAAIIGSVGSVLIIIIDG